MSAAPPTLRLALTISPDCAHCLAVADPGLGGDAGEALCADCDAALRAELLALEADDLCRKCGDAHAPKGPCEQYYDDFDRRGDEAAEREGE
jgi:hypothetical protein